MRPDGDPKQSSSRTDGRFVADRTKAYDVLDAQLKAVETALGVALVPPSISANRNPNPEELQQHLRLPHSDLRSAHKVRYDALVSVLPYLKREQLVPEEIKERFAHQIELLNNLEQSVVRFVSGQDRRLRAPQVEVLVDIVQALNTGEVKGYVKCPTGFGKTRTFAALTEAADVKTLILVPKSLLCGQTVSELKKLAPSLDVKERYGSKDSGDGRVVVSTYQYFLNASKDGRINPADFGLVILDEGHKALGEATLAAIGRIPETVPTVAFTATPTYSDQKSLVAMMGDCWHEVSLSEGVRLGALAPVSVVIAKTEIDLSSVTVTGDHYSEAEFAKAVQPAGLSKSALELYQKAFSDRSAIGFCSSVAHAEEAAKVFNDAGVSAAALSGETSPRERDRVIEEFKAGRIKVLFSADLLKEGFDAANTSVCLNMAPTASVVSAEQRGGRAVRLDPHKPDKFAVIVDFVFRDQRRGLPQIFFSDILGGIDCVPGNEANETLNKAIEAGRRNLGKLQIEGLTLVVDAQEILNISCEAKQDDKATEAPEGWMNVAQIALLLGKSSTVIRTTIKDIGPSVEPLSGRFISPDSGRVAAMYAPGVIPLIRDFRRQSLENAGWLSGDKVAEQLGVENWPVKRLLEELLKENPHLGFKKQTQSGHEFTLYDPAVVEQLRGNSALKYLDWPKGSVEMIKNEVNLPKIVIKDAVKQILGQHPNEVNGDRWSPIFVKRITEYLRNTYFGSYLNNEGKVTVKSLSDYLAIDAKQLIAARQALVPRDFNPWSESSVIEVKNVDAIIQGLLPKLTQPSLWEPRAQHCKREVIVPPSLGDAYPKQFVQSFLLPNATAKSTFYHPLLVKLIAKVNSLKEEEKDR
jgi:superfamily II DNA or RNA helicase